MIPYFYIIQNKDSGLYYVGSKYGVDADPKLLLAPGGYYTSSRIVNDIISEHSLNAFRIIRIKTFETPDAAYAYETKFLKKVNASQNDKFVNKHNNNGGNNIHYTNKGMVWAHDGNISKMFYESEVPDNWSLGRLIDMGKSGKGKIYYTNNKISRRFFEGEQPKGWVRGNHNIRGKKNPSCLYGTPVKGKILYNNGTKSILLGPNETPPKGYILGATESFCEKRSKAASGKNNPMYGTIRGKMYNNGIVNKYFVPGTEPETFKKGMLCKKDQKMK
jgi:hypothetical protein